MAGNPPPDGPGDDVELDTDLEGIDPDENLEAEDDGQDGEGDANAAEDGGNGEGEDAGNDDERQPQGQSRQVSRQQPRREGRYQRLANENRTLKTQLSTFEQQLQALLAQRSQPSAAEQAAAAREEQERVQLMAPHEVAAYYAQKTERAVAQQLNQTRQALFDQNDQVQFNQMLDGDPRLRRYEEKVEELRRQAPAVPRRILLATAIGMAALDGKGPARTRAANAAQGQQQRQTARPSNGRGDMPADRRRSGGNLDDRLRNVLI